MLWRLHVEESGQVIPILLLVITLAVMSIALVVDMGFLYTSKGSVQGAADLAVMAGSEELPNAASAAQRVAEWSALNGYAGGTGGVSVRVEVDGAAPWVNGTQTVEPSVDLDCDRAGYCLRVAISTPHTWMLGQVLSLGGASLTGSARSEKVAIDRDIIMILDRSGSVNTPNGMYAGTLSKMLRFGQSQMLVPGASNDRVGLITMFNASISATHLPYQWTVEGALPPGLSLWSDGRLRGTPTAVGSSTFTLRATDPSGATTTHDVTLAVAAATGALAVTTPSLPPAAVGAWYSYQLSAEGGTPPYTWAITAGSLPSDSPPWSLASGGLLSGNGASTTSRSITVQVTDSVGATATRPLTLDVLARDTTLEIRTATLPDARVNAPYSFPLFASGGLTPFTSTFGPASGTPSDCPGAGIAPLSDLDPVLCPLALLSGGGSQVAPALSAAINEFIARGRSTADWHIVLLTDGVFTDASQSLIDAQVARAATPTNALGQPLNHPVHIHTVGLTSSAQAARLAAMSTATGGGYYAAPGVGGSDPAANVGGQLESLARALNIQLTE